MSKLQNNPNLMTVITNIQLMKAKINPYYNSIEDFQNLSTLNESDLYQIQSECIKNYNNFLKQ